MTDSVVKMETRFTLLDQDGKMILVVVGNKEGSEVVIEDITSTEMSSHSLVPRLRYLADAISSHYARS